MLSAHLGIPREELLERMDSEEITEWMAYYNLQPFGEERADLRMANNTGNIVSCFTKKKYKISDFLLKFKRKKKKQQDWETMRAIGEGIAKIFENNNVKE